MLDNELKQKPEPDVTEEFQAEGKMVDSGAMDDSVLPSREEDRSGEMADGAAEPTEASADAEGAFSDGEQFRREE